MSSIFTRVFWKDTAERAIKTTAQAGAALLTAGGLGLLDVDWVLVGSVSGMAGAVSVLTSIASAGITSTQGASLVVEAVDPPGKHATDR